MILDHAVSRGAWMILHGLAAAVGVAISMGFSEGLSDDGSLAGRGNPVARGAITGAAAFAGASCTPCRSPVAPGLGGAIRGLRGGRGGALLAIPFVRYRHLGMGFPVSAMRVILGGALVFASGVLTWCA